MAALSWPPPLSSGLAARDLMSLPGATRIGRALRDSSCPPLSLPLPPPQEAPRGPGAELGQGSSEYQALYWAWPRADPLLTPCHSRTTYSLCRGRTTQGHGPGDSCLAVALGPAGTQPEKMLPKERRPLPAAGLLWDPDISLSFPICPMGW